MAKISAKENFMKLRHGGTPEYVPFYSLMGAPYKDERPTAGVMLPFFENTQFLDGGKDIWGVVYKAPEGGVEATMPDTSIVMLPDIEDWTKVVKFPKINEVDLERVYRETLKTVDREQTALTMSFGFSPFQELVAMMGFEGGLTALYTDPDEVKAMLNAMIDYLEPLYDKAFDVFKPDIWTLADDTCAAGTPFFSPEIYKDIFAPMYKRMVKKANEHDVPVEFHNCGMIEEFVPLMIDFGVEFTDPAQTVNDILKLKEQYKGKISFLGCWGWGDHIPAGFPDFDEEAFRADIRETIDKYSVGGAYAFAGFPIGLKNEQYGVDRANELMREEVYTYGKKVYGYTGE